MFLNYTNRLQYLATSSRSRTCTHMISQPLYYSLKLYSNLCPRKFKSCVLFCCLFTCCIVESSFDHSVVVVGLVGFATRTNTSRKATQIQLHDACPTVHFNFNKDLHLGKTYCWRYKTQRSQTMPVDIVSEIPHPLAFQGRFVERMRDKFNKSFIQQDSEHIRLLVCHKMKQITVK